MATFLILAEYVSMALGARPQSVTGEHGKRSLSSRDIERVVEDAASEVQGVRSVRPKVRQKRDEIVVSCRASLEPGVMISDVAPQIEGKIRSAVESSTGRNVNAVRLNLEETPEEARAPAEAKSG